MTVTWRLLVTALVVAFGLSFQCGYYASLYTVPQDIVDLYINQSVNLSWNKGLSGTVASRIWVSFAYFNQAGEIFAVFFTPIIVDRIGRKKTFLFSSLISILGILFQYLSQPTGIFILLVLGRLTTEFYIGIVEALVPLFLIEIAVLPEWRGSVMLLHSLASIFGRVVAFFFCLSDFSMVPSHWGRLALIPLPLVIFETIWLSIVPESPMFLIQIEKAGDEIERTLHYYLGVAAEKSETAMQVSLKKEGNPKSLRKLPGWWDRIKEFCKNQSSRKILYLWMILALASSFSGSHLTVPYVTSIFAQGGSFRNFEKYASLAMNSWTILVLLAMLLTVDRFGRKPLLVAASWTGLSSLFVLAAMAFARQYFAASINNFSLTLVRLIFIFLLVSMSHVTNSISTLIVLETAKQKSRAISLGMYVLAYRIVGVCLTRGWPPIFQASEGGAYLLFALPFLASCVYITISCPETKTVDLIGQECVGEMFEQQAVAGMPAFGAVPDVCRRTM